MTKLNTKTVTITVQGETRELDVSKFHADTVDAVFTYGTRRWFQDHINSAAKNARDNGESFDVTAAIDARLAQAESGEITMRNGVASDPLDKYRIAALREFMRTEDGAELKTAYNAIPADDQSGRREFLLAVAAKNAEHVDRVANVFKAIDDNAKAAAGDVSIKM